MMPAKILPFRILKILLFWFLFLEILSRIIISVPFIYTHYIQRVSNAGMRLEYTRRDSGLDQKTRHALFLESFFFQYHPTLGWSIKPSLADRKVFDNKILNTNSKGIRGKVEYSYEKLPHKLRILVLGDSYTFGEEVSDNETYPYYLQQMLPNAEIINMGVPAYGHDQILLYYLQEGVKYHPDIVLLGYTTSDNVRNLLAFYHRPKPFFLWSHDHLKLCHSPVADHKWYLNHEFWSLKFLDLIDILRFDILNKMHLIQKDAQVITDHILDKMVSAAQMNKSKIIFVPISTEFLFPSGAGNSEDVKKEFFKRWEGKQVACIHLKALTDEEMMQGPFLRRKHYKPFVNKKIAQGIRDYLQQNHLVP